MGTGASSGGDGAIIDGLLSSGSFSDKNRRMVTNISILIAKHKNQFGKHYSPDMIKMLPHPYGMNSETALSYIGNAGFRDPDLRPLKDIMDTQRRHMPISRRISYRMPYYLITGKAGNNR